jgi:hypothetical protein
MTLGYVNPPVADSQVPPLSVLLKTPLVPVAAYTSAPNTTRETILVEDGKPVDADIHTAPLFVERKIPYPFVPA